MITYNGPVIYIECRCVIEYSLECQRVFCSVCLSLEKKKKKNIVTLCFQQSNASEMILVVFMHGSLTFFFCKIHS